MSEGLEDLVPEGFDIEEARHQPTSTDTDELDRCPECESLCVRRRVGDGSGGGGAVKYDEPYFCKTCGERFEEPA